MVPLLIVRVTNNTEKTFSMFSRDPSRSLTLSQHYTRHDNWHGHLSTLCSLLVCGTNLLSVLLIFTNA